MWNKYNMKSINKAETKYYEYDLFYDRVLVINIVSIDSKIFYWTIFCLLLSCDQFNTVSYDFDQSEFEMNNKLYQSI